MSRGRWLTFAGVCVVHMLLIGSFASSARFSAQPSGNAESSRLQIEERAVPVIVIQANASPAWLPEPALTPPVESATQQPTPAKFPAQFPPTRQTAQTVRMEPLFPPTLAIFDRDKFLDLEALDQAAVAFSQFELALTNALPASFEAIVLELLINESGRTVQITCIEGDCSDELQQQLAALMDVPFTPAMKNGETVASRKIIQALPASTYGL